MLHANLPHWDGKSQPITYMGSSLIPKGGQRNFDMVQVPCKINNGRLFNLSLNKNGVELISNVTTKLTTQQFYTQPDSITSTYYDECCAFVQHHTGCSKVFAFDHNVRNAQVKLFAERNSNITTKATIRPDGPVRFVHNDYTDTSGPQRVLDLAKPGGSYTKSGALFSTTEAKNIIESKRYVFVNLWRPIGNHPVIDVPLAVCDAQSMQESDFTNCQLIYENRIGQTHIIKHNVRHQWHWFPCMNKHEALLLKCWDSDRSTGAGATKKKCRFTAHTAFLNPNAPIDAPPRESCEVRCLLVFDQKSNL